MVFCGFACILSDEDITHILYIAVEKSLQGKGYGTDIVHQLQLLKPTHRMIADIERESADAVNGEQRHRRKAFYIRNGFHESEVSYEWRQENYEILVSNGELSRKEFAHFWEHVAQQNPNFMRF